jgi:hypothetical protein
VALVGRDCPDCNRTVRDEFEETITGREVCPDCAHALRSGATVGAVTSNVGAGFGVWAMLRRRIRRTD